MNNSVLGAVILALSLCMDCYAVTTCSSVTLKKIEIGKVCLIGLIFGIVQAGLLFLGWAFGDLFVGYVQKFANIIGFALLLYVGGTMVYESLKKDCEVMNLNGLKNVILGAIATSIDAFAVGISLSMDMEPLSSVTVKTIAVFVCTFLSVLAGMYSGHAVGHKFGKVAEMVGGVVLIVIGFTILL